MGIQFEWRIWRFGPCYFDARTHVRTQLSNWQSLTASQLEKELTPTWNLSELAAACHWEICLSAVGETTETATFRSICLRLCRFCSKLKSVHGCATLQARAFTNEHQMSLHGIKKDHDEHFMAMYANGFMIVDLLMVENDGC